MMGVALILGIAVVAWFAFGQPGISATAQVSGQTRFGFPSTQTSGIPNSFAQTQMLGSTVDAGAAAAGSILHSMASNNNNNGQGDSSQGAQAGIAIIGMAVQVFNQLWAAHEARLKGATTENQAVPIVTQVFDQAIAAIAQAWNATHDQTDTINALVALDQQTYAYLKGRVGAPGTAWVDSPSACDKTCTVGCCIYWNDFHAGIYGASVFAGGSVGMIPVIQNGGGKVAYIPKVYPSKYQMYSRESYTVQL